jgi:phage major head subunit gpT-like protein
MITSELLNEFRRTLSTSFMSALRTQRTNEWQRVARRMNSASAANVYPFMGELASMREWLGPRITREMSTFQYAIPNRKFELTMQVKRDELLDDLNGAIAMYSDRAGIFADSVARHPDELVMIQGLEAGHLNLSYDGQNFFDTDHPVGTGVASNDMGGSGPAWYLLDTSKPLMPLIYQEREAPAFQAMTDLSNPHVFMTHEYLFGAHCRDAVGYALWQLAIKSKQPLTRENFILARNRMQSFENDEGHNMRANPTLIVVPRGSLQDDAANLFQRGQTIELVDVGGGTIQAVPVTNTLSNAVQVMVSDYLSVT